MNQPALDSKLKGHKHTPNCLLTNPNDHAIMKQTKLTLNF